MAKKNEKATEVIKNNELVNAPDAEQETAATPKDDTTSATAATKSKSRKNSKPAANLKDRPVDPVEHDDTDAVRSGEPNNEGGAPDGPDGWPSDLSSLFDQFFGTKGVIGRGQTEAYRSDDPTSASKSAAIDRIPTYKKKTRNLVNDIADAVIVHLKDDEDPVVFHGTIIENLMTYLIDYAVRTQPKINSMNRKIDTLLTRLSGLEEQMLIERRNARLMQGASYYRPIEAHTATLEAAPLEPNPVVFSNCHIGAVNTGSGEVDIPGDLFMNRHYLGDDGSEKEDNDDFDIDNCSECGCCGHGCGDQERDDKWLHGHLWDDPEQHVDYTIRSIIHNLLGVTRADVLHKIIDEMAEEEAGED